MKGNTIFYVLLALFGIVPTITNIFYPFSYWYLFPILAAILIGVIYFSKK